MLADTSVWIDHFRLGDTQLKAALEAGAVWMHPLVLGEIACGNLASRARVLTLLHSLPALPVATDKEVLYFIDKHKLMGRGIGYIDAHLLAAARLADVPIWTKDKRLHTIATDMALAYVGSRH